MQNLVTEKQQEFELQVEKMLTQQSPGELAVSFDEKLCANWPLAQVGFAVTLQGVVCAPLLTASDIARRFRMENEMFLSNREMVEVYPSYNVAVKVPSSANSSPSMQIAEQQGEYVSKGQSRKISPQKGWQQEVSQISKATSAEAEFRQLIGDATSGTLARFLQNKLNLMFWYRSPRDRQLVFGAQLHLRKIIEELVRQLVVVPNLNEEICVALLDDNGKPVGRTITGFEANWKRPFVATEIGEVLPHWEVAACLLHPEKMAETVRTLNLTLGLMITVLVAAIGVGGWLIVLDSKRQITMARQKTDFVSNVSHELKTPLTSIRMFSELLADGRVDDPAKRRNYLQIIAAEAARLTRLINNVLDFARMERGEKKYEFKRCNLTGLVTETVENYRPHLEANGIKLHYLAPTNTSEPTSPDPSLVRRGDSSADFSNTSLEIDGDRDALAQVIVNLISNAEKYGGKAMEISVEVATPSNSTPCVQVKIMDRGPGVPRGSEEKIFEQFYRAHDSLSSGIQGAGLGLTLARQIARAHGGDVTYEPREGGGSCFTLELPILDEHHFPRAR